MLVFSLPNFPWLFNCESLNFFPETCYSISSVSHSGSPMLLFLKFSFPGSNGNFQKLLRKYVQHCHSGRKRYPIYNFPQKFYVLAISVSVEI